MAGLFITVVNMSITASIVILVVMLLRLVLRRFPKVFSYFLWIVVVFRLLCPFSFQLPKAPVKPVNIERQVAVMPQVESAINSTNQDITSEIVATDNAPAVVQAEKSTNIYELLPYAWVIGVTAMTTWGIYNWVSIKSRLKNATKRDGYYVHKGIDNSFIFGVIKPRIYIPDSIGNGDKDIILLHERTHLRRGDHIAKIIMYITLCIHWFNPLVWVSFKLFEQDMEMSCDEKTTLNMDKEMRAKYAEALLKVSAKSVAAFTACFGETGIKRRIVNVLKFRKPTKAMAVVCASLVLVSSCTLGANKEEEDVTESEGETTIAETSATVAETEAVEEVAEETTLPIETEAVVRDPSETAVETPPLGNTISDGTYNAFINMYDVRETTRLEILTWDYFELSASQVEALQPGDIIDARECPMGREISVEDIEELTIYEPELTIYGSTYDQIISVAEGYTLWHVEGTDTWRLFEESDSPCILGRVQTCMPLSSDLVIYDQAGYFIDGGDAAGNCYVENTFDNTFYSNGPTQYMFNTVVIENGEITEVYIYMHP